MAGDWLKIEKDTPEKPEIAGLCSLLGIEAEVAFAKCFRLWRWADSNTVDGNARSVTFAFLDALVNAPGFCKALVEVGWLIVRDGGLTFPNFDRHMGQSAKRRGLTAKRVAACKAKKGNAPSVTEALPEKRREEKIEEDTPSECCSEPDKPASEPPPSSPVVMVFPTVGNGHSGWPLTEAKVTEYRQTYPGVDVPAECRRAWQWCQDNPTRRKTVKGMPAFLARWLGKAQDRGPPLASGGKAASLKGMFEDLP